MGQDISIRVHDVCGVEVFNEQEHVYANEYRLSFVKQKSGFYLITVQSGNQIFVKKVIVSKLY